MISSGVRTPAGNIRVPPHVPAESFRCSSTPYPERQRAERARDRAGNAWCRANEPRLRAAVWSLARLDDGWERLARTASAERLTSWHRKLDGPALTARLTALRRILDPVDGELPWTNSPPATASTPARRMAPLTPTGLTAADLRRQDGQPFRG
ncbi:hypothetical protein [Streptomyces sp. NPDC090026]|uniref:hypothetical protein n=1 Tax=Streptomyces sp. NPDC090026 TaxID=3365923 RepID=UPI003812648B